MVNANEPGLPWSGITKSFSRTCLKNIIFRCFKLVFL